MTETTIRTIEAWQKAGVLLVEDGNHGEYRPRPSEFDSSGVAFIRASDMESGEVRFDRASKITPTAVARITKGIGEPGDVLFSHKGTVGKLALVPKDAPPFVCSPQTTFWRVKDHSRLNPKYLYYYMKSWTFRRQWEACKAETDMADYVSLTAQRRFKLPIPGMQEQNRIVDNIAGLDDKIVINRKMNQSLEAMAQALFKSWFVEFGPVVAKRDGHQPSFVGADTARLFPAHFQDSDFGPIPKGWAVHRLSDFVEIVDCLHSKKPERVLESGSILLQLANIADSGLLNMADKYFISAEDYSNWTSNIEAREGDCVITNVGRVGAVAQVPPGVRLALGRNITGLRCRNSLYAPAFLVTLLTSDSMREEIDLHTDSGTILDALNVRNIGRLRFVSDENIIVGRFESLVRPLRAQMEINVQESAILGSLRDLLLPKLLSGESPAKAAERIVTEVI